MTTTATQTVTLTADDIKALRTAEQVVLRHYKRVTTIEAFLDRRLVDEARVYTASEQRLFPDTSTYAHERARTIAVQGSVYSYDEQVDADLASGFSMMHSAQYSPVWTTIVSLLRAGDEVLVSFIADGSRNGYVKSAGLHADDVRLVVTRGERKMTFQVDSTVAPANSARMVKPQG